MPYIAAAASAFPPHVAAQSVIRDAASALFAGAFADESPLRVFDNSRIDRRQFMLPLESYLQPLLPSQRNGVYREEGAKLLRQAATEALRRGGIDASAVTHLFFVSSTGHAAPTLDAYLINDLGLSPSVRRTPVWGLGCAAGAAAVARAADVCTGAPERVVLVLSLETCSLTFLDGDMTKKNVIAAALFADGAAATVVTGDMRPGPLRICGTRSHLFPDTYRIMGWDFRDEGMELVLSPKLPLVVKQEVAPLADAFLAERGLSRRDLRFYITHPGGARVIDAYREALELSDGDLAITEEVLRNHGNMSSPSVLVVLEKWLAGEGVHEGGFGLMSAFGPGFSAEMLLVEEA